MRCADWKNLLGRCTCGHACRRTLEGVYAPWLQPGTPGHATSARARAAPITGTWCHPPWPGQPPRCRCKCSHLTFCASATHPQTVRRKWASLLRRVLGFARRHLARHLQAVWLIFATGDACQGRPTHPSCSVNPCLGHTFCTWQYLPCRTVRPDPIGGSKQARGSCHRHRSMRTSRRNWRFVFGVSGSWAPVRHLGVAIFALRRCVSL